MQDRVIIKPVVSEKSFSLANAGNKYTFLVEPSATKIDIKNAIEKMHKVKVENVNITIKPGKLKMNWAKRREKRKSDKKKAVVTLKKGDKIDEFLNI
jgi:large subunit ribosomal protein L23